MKYKIFGKSGLRVSEICLGTMTFGEEFGWGNSKEESRKVFDAYAEVGGNFLDTANYYTRGTSEKYLGEFTEGKREKFVIATKYTLTTDPKDPNASGNHRKNLIQSLEASLKRLNTDYIDLYWVHAWDYVTPIDEMMRALDDAVRSGKVLYIGISDAPAWTVARANTLADWKGWSPFIGMQLEYSLLERTIEREFFDLARYLHLAIAAWSPLAMGMLTGKYSKEASKDSRFEINKEWGNRYFNDRNFAIVGTLLKIADEIGKSPTQVALNWIRQNSQPTIIPIVGAKKAEQLKENLGCLNFELSPSILDQLDEASKIDLGFPHAFIKSEDIKKIIFGESTYLFENKK